MTTSPLLFASDFDGTFYFENTSQPFYQEDFDAIRRFQEKGNLFGVCTGRSLAGVLATSLQLPKFDFCILSSGAMIYDQNGTALYKKTIPHQTVDSIYQQFQDITSSLIMGERYAYAFTKAGYPVVSVQDIDDLLDKDICSMSLRAETPEIAAEICKIVNDRYKDDVIAYHNVNCADIAPRGCSKGNAIAILRQHYGLSDVCGIGDSYNDITLLESVTRPFTFHHAPDEVKAKAKTLVSSLAEALDLCML